MNTPAFVISEHIINICYRTFRRRNTTVIEHAPNMCKHTHTRHTHWPIMKLWITARIREYLLYLVYEQTQKMLTNKLHTRQTRDWSCAVCVIFCSYIQRVCTISVVVSRRVCVGVWELCAQFGQWRPHGSTARAIRYHCVQLAVNYRTFTVCVRLWLPPHTEPPTPLA